MKQWQRRLVKIGKYVNAQFSIIKYHVDLTPGEWVPNVPSLFITDFQVDPSLSCFVELDGDVLWFTIVLSHTETNISYWENNSFWFLWDERDYTRNDIN